MDRYQLSHIEDRLIILYKNGKLGEIIDIIENNLDEKEVDIIANKIYTFSLIRLGRFKEAELILDKLLESYPEDHELLNAMAYLELVKGNRTAGINLLLDAEYYAPSNVRTKIRSNLDEISKYTNLAPDLVIKQVKSKDFLILDLPDIRRKRFDFIKIPSKGSLFIVIGVLVIGLVVYFGASYILGVFSYSNHSDNIVSDNINRIDIESNSKLVDISPLLTNEITLTDKQVSELFNELKLLLSKNRASNRARFIANYLLNSNASPSVKAKVEVLRTFMEEPVLLDWSPLYEEVNSKPNLYNGVFVIWKGRIVNVEKVGDSANFVFVVHGNSPSSVKGFIKSRMDNFLDGYVGEDIEVLGEIVTSGDVYLNVKKVLR